MQKMLSHLRKCIDDYAMIAPGDRIAVGVSGGKDSLSLLLLLARLRDFYPLPFDLSAITLDMGYENPDYSPIADLCAGIGVEYIIKPTQIKQIVFDVRHEKNPCALCAKLRRGALNDTARENQCNKVALGHHFDDAVETFMMSLFYEGRISCFQPVTELERAGVTVIRPMLYMTEREVINFAHRQALPVCKNPCPADKNTRREDMKQMIRHLEHDHHDLRRHIFGAMQRRPLDGWGIISKAGPPQEEQHCQPGGPEDADDGRIEQIQPQ